MTGDKDRDDPKASSTAYVAVVGVILLAISIYMIHALYYGVLESEAMVKDWEQKSVGELEKTRQMDELRRYEKRSADGKLFAIPVERAMQLEVERVNRRQ